MEKQSITLHPRGRWCRWVPPANPLTQKVLSRAIVAMFLIAVITTPLRGSGCISSDSDSAKLWIAG